MTFRLDINVSSLAELSRLLEDVDEAVDVERVLDEGSAILLNRIRTRFLDAEDAQGRPWVESQAARRRNSDPNGGGKTLFDTGTLFHSLQVFTDAPGVRGLGTDVPYSIVHHDGLDGNPVRRFLEFNDEDGDILTRLVEDRIAKAIS